MVTIIDQITRNDRADFPRTALLLFQLDTWHHETLRANLGQSDAYKQANLERPIVEVLVPQS
jgi:hypothetical protein